MGVYCMSGKVSEWVEKAQGDYETASREMQVGSRPNYDAVCFHCQQCVEKLLKGALRQAGVDPPHVHDVAYLSKLLREAGVAFAPEEGELRLLSQSAVIFRYPGENATVEDTKEVMAICERLRNTLLKLIDEGGA